MVGNKAKFTIDGKVFLQSGEALVSEAQDLGITNEHELIDYLHDCYVADESGFVGDFSKWMDWLFN